MQIKLVYPLLLILVFSCNKKDDRFTKEVPDLQETITVNNVSEKYYDSSVNNQSLVNSYPDFFNNIPDSILTSRRADSISLVLNKAVEKEFNNKSLVDSLNSVFKYVKYYYPDFVPPTVYTFTGELPYMNPVAYWRQSNDMVIGPDWFLGKNYPIYEQMGIPAYLRENMQPKYFKVAIAESIAKQYIPIDITKRKFVERMIYAGKVLIATQAFLPDKSPQTIIGYTPEQWQWSKENEVNVYIYFTEQEYLFSEDKKLSERFIEPAPFSKFFSDNDKETPGKIGAWVGMQICNAYLEKHPDVDLVTFLNDTNYLKIFNESKYKPTK
ncbi:hypothetical protein KRX57_04060 [Weeksellaceae bacterium TAE3-ERU29]|nr:hypothetical protein [Weeksellaceae bacterium TAE3-ERU29]